MTPAAANSTPKHPQPSSHAAPRVHLAAMPAADSQASTSKTSRQRSKQVSAPASSKSKPSDTNNPES
ncbi:hypothetical protein [Lacticaseibacillus zeae]|uniref:hypothetical protein n=1 Tax=Lacticaseibacillus zeae TaxID=57037 RepID=UPI0030B8371D